ncbi:DUF928 domain-containing protein [Pseudanabaena sp. UWO311]|uniref:DUF928 domain-containing protein n=1 Tax=Pseudanabaena sp. UWO311 TaxID=2487337 RepID=UPI00168043AD|nr:DUF928 domain-containing protein [Pseudanabaena sp. UWO311]
MRLLIDILDLAWRRKITRFSGTLFSLLFLSVIYGNVLAAIAKPKHTRYGLGIDQKFIGGVPHSIPNYCISIIAPDDGGRTSSERPNLYAYVYKYQNLRTSSKSNLGIDFRIKESQSFSRSVFRGQETIAEVGLYKMILPVANPALLNGKIQRWSMAVIDEWGEIYPAYAYIQRESNLDLEREVKGENMLLGKARIYAKYFYWYDAFDAYNQWLEVNPTDQIARRERAKLLQESRRSQCINYRYISSAKLLELIDAKSAKPIAFTQKKQM